MYTYMLVIHSTKKIYICTYTKHKQCFSLRVGKGSGGSLWLQRTFFYSFISVIFDFFQQVCIPSKIRERHIQIKNTSNIAFCFSRKFGKLEVRKNKNFNQVGKIRSICKDRVGGSSDGEKRRHDNQWQEDRGGPTTGDLVSERIRQPGDGHEDAGASYEKRNANVQVQVLTLLWFCVVPFSTLHLHQKLLHIADFCE